MGHGLFRMTQADSVTYEGYKKFYDRLAPGDNMLAYDDDPNSTIMIDGYANGSRSIWVNGKSDGSTRGGDRATTLMVAHLPALFQRSTSDKVTVIGFGTGITTGALTRHDQFKQVNVLEISSAVKNFSPFFDGENGAASQSEKVRWHLGDAYRFLIESSDVYAVIASEPSNPWVGGVERLYSQEFYQIVRQKLAHRGVFAQWFHTYSISDKTLVMVLSTFSSVFPHAHFFTNGGDIILLGSSDPFDRETIEIAKTRMSSPGMARDLRDMSITGIPDLFAREEWVPWSGFTGAALHTLDKPKLSHAAGRDFFLGSNANIKTINQTSRFLWHARQSLSNTLLGVSLQSPNKIDFIKAVARSTCGMAEPSFFSGWDRKGYDCQVPLMSLLAMNQIARPGNIAASTVSVLQGVQKNVRFTLPPATDPQSAKVGLHWIQQYGAPFLDIDSIKIQQYAEICLMKNDAVSGECRAQLALTLLATGFEAQGREEFSRIVSEGVLVEGSSMLRVLRENFSS
jgi:spermidine synthase